MNYSNHALRRMNARNITVAMVETSFDDCLKFGNWDQKGDRLTIDATSDDFHEHIQSTQKNLLNLKQQLAALKEKAKLEKLLTEPYETLKRKYKRLKLKLRALKKLEHKSRLTLVVSDEQILITAFVPTKHFRRDIDYHKYYYEALAKNA